MAGLARVLQSKLLSEFPDRGLRIESFDDDAEGPVAVFPGICSEVGDIEIYDDGDESRVHLGNFTHGHFGGYDRDLTDHQRNCEIAENVAVFVSEVFADKVKFYGTTRGGGWCPVDAEQGSVSKRIGGPHNYFVWSGPHAAKK